MDLGNSVSQQRKLHEGHMGRINYDGVPHGSQRSQRVPEFRVPLTELKTLCFVRQPIEDASHPQRSTSRRRDGGQCIRSAPAAITFGRSKDDPGALQ
ncbi:hypothetical protein CERZMDRAFT_92428 [Cercospora zeae-maydis SCOH1-5]|uniref:Uncharacterized protein n=1 Tax=Cercospora zeae-maydis SCOH1-5 TaxID=717836 RepID=A0A6A6FX11_9PEZI|nr:hypothetical protein CERZMDRAFT_92428 [Cercospora zeae-maydis SCOH1-5]